ncbi:porin [Burkholderia guangdongensis]|uniref:porin n=1 Tax=Burkholderia guangdongensis TaxID=1792500 RepID=UPI0015C9D646|nr:porin [Burkholderia guangdongensis]
MKKLALSTLSLALVGAAGAAHAQSSVTLYGTLDTSIAYVHGNNGQGNNSWQMLSGNESGNKWGLKGTEDLGGGLKAIFQLESGFNPANGQLGQNKGIFGRQAYVGLQSDQAGTVTLGRQYDPTTDLVQGMTGDNIAFEYATPGDVDNNDNSARFNNVVKYTSPVFSGFQFEGMYALSGVAGKPGTGQSWGAAAAYNNGPLGVSAGYLHMTNGATRTAWTSPTADAGATFDGPINSGYATAKSVGIAQVAGQYAFGPVAFGLGYSNAQYNQDALSAFASTEKYNTGRAWATFQATPAVQLGLGYSYTKASGDADAKYHQVTASGQYALSKRTDVYLIGAYQHASGYQRIADTGNSALDFQSAQASIASTGGAGTSSAEIVAVGLRHKF